MPLAAPVPIIGHHALLVFLLQVAFLLLLALVLGRRAMRFSLPTVTGEHWHRTAAAARAARQTANAALATRIRTVHQDSDGTYGVPRITAELRATGELVNHKRVARVMRQVGLADLRLRRKHRTTISDPAAVEAADLIGRDFTAAAVNTKYVGDITCLPLVGGKFLYLATVIDLASRRPAGWAIADHMRSDPPRFRVKAPRGGWSR